MKTTVSENRFAALDSVFFLFITVLGLLNGQVSVFYIIYLFWFQELLRTLISFIFMKKSPELGKNIAVFFMSLFPMTIYFVFIIVLFGFMLNWNNWELMALNFETFLFRNIYFNISLFFFLAESVFFSYLNRKTFDFSENVQAFNPRHLILHISIILGAIIQLFIVKKFPEYFSPENLWGSVLVITPFLALRLFFNVLQKTEN